MQSRPSIFLSLLRVCVRLGLGLLLLGGLCVALGGQVQPAHAATDTVTDCSGENGPGQIGTVISNAAVGDTINFSCSGTIPITSTLIISKNLIIDGSGQSVTLDGGNSTEVLFVNGGVNLTLNALTIAHGAINGLGGGLENQGTVMISNSTFANNSAASGAGLYNAQGTVMISNSTFANNSAATGGSGGGLFNVGGSLTISNSTFANNSAARGGGLFSQSSSLTISNSTFANNSSSCSSLPCSFGGEGGGFYSQGDAKVTISNSTFANNSAALSNGGAGLFNTMSPGTISGSIVAENIGGDCAPNETLFTDQGYNLSSDSSCGFSGTGSLQNTNPMLGPLASNGGPTQTIALQQGSPAIDVIPLSANICPNTDQRGDPRPDADTPAESSCNMGAYESNSAVTVDSDLALSNVPANITTPATSTQGATVNYTSPTVVDEDNPLPPVSCTPASGSTFPIGTTTVTCTATDSDDSNSPVSTSFTVTVQPVLSERGTSVSATEGKSFSGVVVASGVDYGAGTLSASIDWGDGQISTGSVSLATNGSYSVTGTGSHTYDEEGSYAIKVTVSASGRSTASASSSASVTDAALTANTPTAVINKLAVTLSTVFFDADPNGTASDYTATITWGDSTTSAATIGSSGASFSATGSHKYAKHGTYTVTVTIKDAGGSSTTKTLTIKV